ncbi:MAG: DUF4914 family protein [Sedimentisphaerales bacterium]|nr:DUF4914 family protein [Sedimentisphaerales bacterium]
MQSINFIESWQDLGLPAQVKEIIAGAKSVLFPTSRQEIFDLAMGGKKQGTYDVSYPVDGKEVLEVVVTKVRNGLTVNYVDPYLRRRDPDCSFVADSRDTDRVTYESRFGGSFEPVRGETFEWLKGQDLVVTLFNLGSMDTKANRGGVLLAPKNAGFFIGGLADLQGFVNPLEMPADFEISSAIYLAPPFRHTHYNGRQVVVHNRLEHFHEVFSYNLYPGPSAKKGVYGILLNIGEAENWPTLHASTVQVETPYDNITTIMHEGASGGGKSEMLEYPHREPNGRLLLGHNPISGEDRTLAFTQSCKLYPVTDDMALTNPVDTPTNGFLEVRDAEQAWFLRVNHIDRYGTDPHLEKQTVHPKAPLIFLNIDAAPDATALIWDHIEDAPGKPCPNPRVIMPRSFMPGVVNDPAEVMIRSFGVRTPPCTRENPTYGIIGYLHILPPALAWLWRLVAPRGHGNPSISGADSGLVSEGVGSYWPFATGRVVDQANLLLRQMVQTPKVRYVLIPNQHVGCWQTGFMPQWISREYLARRGTASFRSGQLVESRCSLLGYSLDSMQVEGQHIPRWMLQVQLQREIGTDGYDRGSKILYDFFYRELKKIMHSELDQLGKDIIACCLDDGGVDDYVKMM